MNKDSCSFYGLVAQVLFKTLKEIREGRAGDYLILKTMCLDLEEQIEQGEMEHPCLECENCLMFMQSKRVAYGYLFYGKEQKWVIEEEQQLRKLKGVIRNLQNLDSVQINLEDFNRSPYIPNNKPLVYLDHNIIDKFHKEEEKRKKLVPGYANIQYVYSPSHLEEINRMNNEDEEQKMLSTIREITASFFISHSGNNELSLVYEDPDYGMRRVLKNEFAPDAEAFRAIISYDRNIFYPQHTDETYLRELNFDQVFNHETVMRVYEEFQLEALLDENGHPQNFLLIHQAIHALVRALDNLGYKNDKGRAIKSSVHDIEHMIYATGTDILVTMDKKLKNRSELMYQRLGISTKVMDWDEYIKFIK
ncbi:hypothetical protein [Paenibacillus lautus]|uniref:hypothetical protein n=1 Tax=Paenibacillus lautus TaxID=1401 RepID=UPI001C7DD37F|nr:hypothetical protein [Paenibacillus lautus]MBX4149175.1 hypothetical protein [Paenibacillus lautus]